MRLKIVTLFVIDTDDVVDQSLSRVQIFATPWTQSLFKLVSIESVMPSNHLILCRPLLLLPSIFPSIRVFSNESALHTRWPEYWSFSFRVSASKEHSRLISFRMDWLDLLAAQGTLKSLLQHCNENYPPPTQRKAQAATKSQCNQQFINLEDFPRYIPRSGIGGSHGNSLFCFLRNIHAVLHKWLYQFIFLSMPQVTSPSPASTFVDFFFSDGHSDCCSIIPHCNFYLNSSNNQWYGASLHVCLGHLGPLPSDIDQQTDRIMGF